jgi:hypothetical protein
MSFVDEIYQDGVPPVDEDVSPFAGTEDENPEAHMDSEEVK